MRSFAALALLLAATGCAALGGEPRLNDAQTVIADLKFPGTGAPSDLVVSGAFDRPDRGYRSGDPIGITVTANHPASIAVLRVLRGGETTIVFPSKANPEARAAGGVVRFTVPAGTEGTALFEFIAATDGSAWLFTRKPRPGADYAELGSTSRAIAGDLQTTFRGAPHGSVAASHQAVRVGD